MSFGLFAVAAASGGSTGDSESDAEHGADGRPACPTLQQDQERART